MKVCLVYFWDAALKGEDRCVTGCVNLIHEQASNSSTSV